MSGTLGLSECVCVCASCIMFYHKEKTQVPIHYALQLDSRQEDCLLVFMSFYQPL